MSRPRSRRSAQAIHAQRLNALAYSRSPECRIKRLRLSIKLGDRWFGLERDRERDEMSPALLKHYSDGLARQKSELAALEAAQAPTAYPAITLDSIADLDPRWLLLDAAARLLGVHPAHLARRCRHQLARRGQAVRVAVKGGAGPLRWAVARSIDPRLADPPGDPNKATSGG